jgi:5-methylcytosine-specific restriction protein B
MASFSWIPIHRETATHLLGFRDKQPELLGLLAKMRDAGLTVISLNDQDAAGNAIELTELDPFSFFATFNRGLTDKKRQDLWSWLKNRWHLQSPVPTDFDGIPIVNAQRSWFIPYAGQRDKGDVPALWQLFAEALNSTPEKIAPGAFDRCLQVAMVGMAKLTAGLFWINPTAFISLDKYNRAYFANHGVECSSVDSYEAYMAVLDEVGKKLGGNYTEISRAAYSEIPSEERTPIPDIEDGSDSNVRYWLLAPGEGGRLWDDFLKNGIAAIGWDSLGDFMKYKDREAIQKKLQHDDPEHGSQRNNSLACYEFCRGMKPGDIIFAKAGLRRLLGVGRIIGDYTYDPSRDEYHHTRKVEWFRQIEGVLTDEDTQMARKTLTDITGYPDYIQMLKKLAGWTTNQPSDEPEAPSPEIAPPFSIDDALKELFISRDRFEEILFSLSERKNIVLQGAPGVGKSFMARLLGYALLKQKDETRVKMVQFHQSYSYEDFIEGYRPADNGFKLQNGVLRDFCEQARLHPNQDYVFIIDEINRGNLSRIFGELMLLIEADKRSPDCAVPLLYSRKDFYIPKNLHFIGLMNTADRSLAMVDYALRRRFRFFTLMPQFDSEKFSTHLKAAGCEAGLIESMVSRFQKLNSQIASPESGLGQGYQIGHSFFCPAPRATVDSAWYSRILHGEIKPLLEEYWFDEPDRVSTAMADLEL